MSDTTSVLHRHPKTRNFTQIENTTIRDSGLSYRATGLLIYLLSLEDGSRIDSITLADRKAEGRDAIRAAYKELESAGYVRRAKDPRGNDGKWVSSIHVYEVPVPENPAPVDPASVIPASETQALSTKEGNTENKDGISEPFHCPTPVCDRTFPDTVSRDDHYENCGDPDFIPADAIAAPVRTRG